MPYQLVSQRDTALALEHKGKAEVCVFEFKLLPEQLQINRYFYSRMADSFLAKLHERKYELLRLNIWEDKKPTLWTNYRCEVISTTGSVVPWSIIITLVLGIIFLIALTFVIREIKTIDWAKVPPEIPAGFLIGAGILALAMLRRK